MKINQQVRRIILIALLLLAGLAWTIASATPPDTTTGGLIPAPRAGFLAPDFTLRTPIGVRVTLSELRGQAVILNLWATWCPPCQAEMPALQRVYQDYRERGLTVLAVNATDQDRREAVAPFAQQNGLTFPILLDESGEVSRLYLLRSLPTTFFIDAEGVIREVVVGGPISEALLRSWVERLLPEMP